MSGLKFNIVCFGAIPFGPPPRFFPPKDISYMIYLRKEVCVFPPHIPIKIADLETDIANKAST